MTLPESTTVPNVSIHQGKATTTTEDVAIYFGKQHHHVVQKLESLDCSKEFTIRNFSRMVKNKSIGSGAVREVVYYEMTKDGFVFLVMGFTGKKAAQFKEAYIAEFNRMEAELNIRVPQPQSATPKKRGPYKNRKSDLPCGVYHHQSKYNPYRAYAWNGTESVYVGCYPTVDAAVAAIEHYRTSSTVQRLPATEINITGLMPELSQNTATENKTNHIDLVNHLKVFLEAAQLLSGYRYGKDLAWDLIAFTQEEASRHC